MKASTNERRTSRIETGQPQGELLNIASTIPYQTKLYAYVLCRRKRRKSTVVFLHFKVQLQVCASRSEVSRPGKETVSDSHCELRGTGLGCVTEIDWR